MVLKDWKKENYTFENNGFIRYHGGSNKHFNVMQIAHYRGADDFDKAMGYKFKWHNKWYVDIFGKGEHLFNTKAQALAYAKAYMRKH